MASFCAYGLGANRFCVYGLGATGQSVINYLNRERKYFSDYYVWDDDAAKRNFFGVHKGEKKVKAKFSEIIDFTDFIVLSPGISLKKAKLKKKLIKNRHKIITDLDLFYLLNPEIKTIVVTGTNGKSTTCKILEHILRKNNINVRLGGNIGKPVLDLDLKNKPLVIIEASSFQLAYSKYIKPDYALILNVTKDHLDWHGSYKNYVDSKFKIFSKQKRNNFAFISNKILLKKFKKEKYKSKLEFVNIESYNKIKNGIKNDYLNSESNEENMSFIYALSKILKIDETPLVNSLKSFKGLPHRHEIFYKKGNKIFINDSKATSFEATKSALRSNKNIFWIVGGLPKVGDRFQLGRIKKNIIKAYIIGKNISFFRKQIGKTIPFTVSKNMQNAVNNIFKDLKSGKNSRKTILLSPAAASFDQFNNFENRGNYFKKLIVKKFKKRSNA